MRAWAKYKGAIAPAGVALAMIAAIWFFAGHHALLH